MIKKQPGNIQNDKNDIKTIKKHLHLLKGTNHFKIYETISKEITKLNK